MEMVVKIKTWKPFCPMSRLQSAKQCDGNIKEWRRGYNSLICEAWLHEDKQTSKHNLLLSIVDQGWTVRNLKCNFFFLPHQPAVLPVHKSEIELWGNLGEISMKFQEKNSCQRGAPPTLELLSQRGLVTKGKAEVVIITILKSVGREEVIILPNYCQLTILNTRGRHSAVPN